MGLLDRIKGTPPSVESLEQRHAEAVEAQRQAESDYRAACLAAASGGASEQKARTEAGKALEKATRNLQELEAALEAARQYEAEAEAKADADAIAAAWAQVREHVNAREKAAKDAEAAIAKLADAADRIAEANTGIVNTAPKRPDISGALVGTWDTEAALRLALLKAGFAWASQWPWGAESAPTFKSRIDDANAYVLRVADEHEHGASERAEA